MGRRDRRRALTVGLILCQTLRNPERADERVYDPRIELTSAAAKQLVTRCCGRRT
jgi:hypothetical protein